MKSAYNEKRDIPVGASLRFFYTLPIEEKNPNVLYGHLGVRVTPCTPQCTTITIRKTRYQVCTNGGKPTYDVMSHDKQTFKLWPLRQVHDIEGLLSSVMYGIRRPADYKNVVLLQLLLYLILRESVWEERAEVFSR